MKAGIVDDTIVVHFSIESTLNAIKYEQLLRNERVTALQALKGEELEHI